jgi:osmotically-inducible protein OsmY
MAVLRTFIGIVVLAAAGWGAAGPAGTGRPAPTQRGARSAVQPSKSDAALEREIRAKLAKSKIGGDGFQVHVQGGVATLEGKTDVIQHKGVATHLAKSAGAVAVKNQIQISDAARQKAAKNLETGRRRAQIKRGEARSEATPAHANR